MSLALVLLALGLGQEARAEAVPMSVRVELPAEAGPELSEWARELKTALAARKDEFRLAKPAAKAELVVRLDSIGEGPDGTKTLAAALVRAEQTRPFTYTFGDVTADAEKLARNLRRLADQMAEDGK